MREVKRISRVCIAGALYTLSPVSPPPPAPSPRPPRTLWGNRPSFAASASTTPYGCAFLAKNSTHKFKYIYITHATRRTHNSTRTTSNATSAHNRGRDHHRAQQGAGPSSCTTGNGGTINHHVATGTSTRQRPMRPPQAPASHHDAPRKAVAHAMRQRSMAARTVSKAGSDRSLPLVLLSTCWTSWPPVAVVS